MWLKRVAHAGMLRPVEMLKLWRDMYLPSEWEQDRPMIIAVAQPKNRTHAAQVQFRLVRSSAVIFWGNWLRADTEPDESIWPASARLFRYLFDFVPLRTCLFQSYTCPWVPSPRGELHLGSMQGSP